LAIDGSESVISPLLVECNLGVWQGLTPAEIDVKYPGTWAAREANKWEYVVPSGESYALVDIRARQWLACKRKAPVTIAVTHAILSRTLQGAYGGLNPTGTLGRSHPHDRVYCLHDGRIDELCT
jgi:probable phosphoglycerate mutase